MGNACHILITTIQDLTRVTDDEKAIAIGKILADWNPLGNGAVAVTDLNEYEYEARDVLWVMELYGYPV
ncbi:MAG: hypothetical protein OER85_07410 [Gammaproteobacteria bacterium]|nr:hypothetical protein [Gammaproteobacteria bacterium]